MFLTFYANLGTTLVIKTFSSGKVWNDYQKRSDHFSIYWGNSALISDRPAKGEFEGPGPRVGSRLPGNGPFSSCRPVVLNQGDFALWHIGQCLHDTLDCYNQGSKWQRGVREVEGRHTTSI